MRAQLDGTQAHLRAHHAKIRAEADAIKAGMRLDLEEFAKRVRGAAARGDRSRRRRRREAATCSRSSRTRGRSGPRTRARRSPAQLERLAEEIIQVTNENVAEAMATLSRELGPADTKVDLEVDTLKYDVGVFALGALGTGIFLFVNTLVGGLLTLAAPILAVVLEGARRGRDQDAGEEERARGDRARRRRRCAPRFEQIIDDFQARLSDFVTAAGDTLHNGISEVLDRALAERRAQGVDVEARDAGARRAARAAGRHRSAPRGAARPAVGIFDRLDRLADQLGDLIVPDDVRAHVELGAAYLERGDLDVGDSRAARARSSCGPIIRARSYLLGVAYARRGDDRRGAIEALVARGARCAADSPRRSVALGEVHRRRGDDRRGGRRLSRGARRAASATRRCAARSIAASAPSTCASDATTRRCASCARRWRRCPTTPRRRRCSGARCSCAAIYETARVCLERATQAASASDPLALAVARRICTSGSGRRADARAGLSSARSQREPTPTRRSRRGSGWRGCALGGGRRAGGAHEQLLRALGARSRCGPTSWSMLGRMSAPRRRRPSGAAAPTIARSVAAQPARAARPALLFDRAPAARGGAARGAARRR